jgi:hypothetical protein
MQIYNVGMDSTQYTIRGVPPSVDKELRRMARISGRSLNAVSLEVLRIGLSMPPVLEPNHNLDELSGVIDEKEERRINQAVKRLRVIDSEDW